MNILVQQSTAALGHEEVWAAARSKMSITPFGVAEQSFAGRSMQGHETRFAERSPMASDRRMPVTAINPNR
jgi:hypothetical protein